MLEQPDFIIIDDEDLSNLVCKYQIARVCEKANVKMFTDQRVGLEYITELIRKPLKNKTFLFLDINMPGMSGWELMNEFESSGQIPRDKLFIYMLSSSIDPLDMEITEVNPNIVGFIAKPLSVETLNSIVSA